MTTERRRALIAAGNRGIDLAIAQGLVEAGLKAIIGSRDLAAGESAASGIGASAIALDVADAGSVSDAVAALGHVDALVDNAGVLGSGGVLDDVVNFNDSMAVMVSGPFLLMHHLTPAMVPRTPWRLRGAG